MLDAQPIDVSIVRGAVLLEIRAQVRAVGADGRAQFSQRQVVLQIQLRVLAIVLQQSAYGGQERCAPRSLFVLLLLSFFRSLFHLVQHLQRFHAPYQYCNNHYGQHLYSKLRKQVDGAEFVQGEHQHQAQQQCRAVPHLLVLQVGIVLAQPTSVVAQRVEDVSSVCAADNRDILGQHWYEVVIVSDGPNAQCDEQRGHHGEPYGPQRSAAVLQHAQHDDDGQRHQRNGVQTAGNGHTCQLVAHVPDGPQHAPPDVAHRHGGHEGRRPAPQLCGRLNIVEHVPRSQPQIEASHNVQHSHCTIQHQVNVILN